MSDQRLRASSLAVALAGVVAGVVEGLIWAKVAPRQTWVVYPPDANHRESWPAGFPTESPYRFNAIAMFALMSLVIGVLIAVAAWKLRTSRGVVMLLSASFGAALGSVLALLIGPAVAGGELPAVVAQAGVSAPTLVTMPPAMTWLLVVVAPLAVTLVYTFASMWHPDPDLGTGRRSPAGGGATSAGSAGSVAAHRDPAHAQVTDGDRAAHAVTAPIPVVAAPVSNPPMVDGTQRTDPSPDRP